MGLRSNPLIATIFSALILGSGLGAASSSAQSVASKSKATATISCLHSKLDSIGGAPPHLKNQAYEVKAFFGKIAPSDRTDEIHLLVYGANRRSASLYEAYVDKVGDRTSVTIGEWATFTASSGGLVPDELPGGLATHQRLANAARRIAKEPALILTEAEVRAVQPSCVWKP